MNPDALAWALAQPTGNRWRGLADAFTSGTTRVSFDGRTVDTPTLREPENPPLPNGPSGILPS